MNNIESSTGEIVMYQPDETIRLEVRMDEETVWLTQQQMAELFQKDQSVVARHINNAFKEGELDENSNMHFLHNTRYKYRPTKVYSLDVIISVGYRVKSKRGTAFRQWANKVLKDYLLRGFAINQRIAQIEQRTDTRFESHAARISALEDKVDFSSAHPNPQWKVSSSMGRSSMPTHRSSTSSNRRNAPSSLSTTISMLIP